jgi:hypothetical protein
MVSAGGHSIAGWCDEHDMYINEEITVHCVPLLTGAEDIHDIDDIDKQKEEVTRFRENLRVEKKMIREEAEIADIERLFSKITKLNRSNPITDYYHEIKKDVVQEANLNDRRGQPLTAGCSTVPASAARSFPLSPIGGEGWGEGADSRESAELALTLPALRAGSLPLPHCGRGALNRGGGADV